MGREFRCALAVIALLAVAGSVLVSQAVADDADTCVKGAIDDKISACTREINSGRLRGRELASAYSNRGLVYLAKRNNDRAIQDYDQAIRLNPQDYFAFYSRGDAYNDKGQYDRAIQDYDEAINLYPDFALAFNNRGNAYGNKKEYDRAIQDYDQAIKLSPRLTRAINNRADALAKKNMK